MFNKIRCLLRNQKGFGLLETLAALAILSLTSVAFVQGVVLTSQGTSLHEKRVVALSIAQSQAEYVKSLPFDEEAQYDVGVSLVAGYGVSMDVETSHSDERIRQEIVVGVDYQGDFVLSLTVLKLG